MVRFPHQCNTQNRINVLYLCRKRKLLKKQLNWMNWLSQNLVSLPRSWLIQNPVSLAMHRSWLSKNPVSLSRSWLSQNCVCLLRFWFKILILTESNPVSLSRSWLNQNLLRHIYPKETDFLGHFATFFRNTLDAHISGRRPSRTKLCWELKSFRSRSLHFRGVRAKMSNRWNDGDVPK